MVEVHAMVDSSMTYIVAVDFTGQGRAGLSFRMVQGSSMQATIHISFS